MTPKNPTGPRRPTTRRSTARWGENVVIADFGARRRAERQQHAPEKHAGSRSWIGTAIMQSVVNQTDSGRLARGRDYYRSGQVLDLALEPNSAVGTVAGSQLEPFHAVLHITPLSARNRAFIHEHFSTNLTALRRMQDGETPDLDIAYLLLRADQFRRPHCNCPDPAPVCKHIVATAYRLAEVYELNPAALLRWREIPEIALPNAGGGEIGRAGERGAGRAGRAGGVGGADRTGQGDGSGSTGTDSTSANNTDAALVDPAEFWGDAQQRITWQPLTPQIGLELGERSAWESAVRSVSWTGVEQLQAQYELERAYEILTGEDVTPD